MNKRFNIVMLCLVMALLCLVSDAATIDLTATGSPPYGAAQQSRVYTIQKVIDLSATTVGSGDVLQVIDVNAGSVVERVICQVETGSANAVTMDTGDGANATQYLSNTSSTNAASTASAGSASKYYAAADTIDLHFDAAPGATGVIRIKAVITTVREDRD